MKKMKAYLLRVLIDNPHPHTKYYLIYAQDEVMAEKKLLDRIGKYFPENEIIITRCTIE